MSRATRVVSIGTLSLVRAPNSRVDFARPGETSRRPTEIRGFGVRVALDPTLRLLPIGDAYQAASGCAHQRGPQNIRHRSCHDQCDVCQRRRCHQSQPSDSCRRHRGAELCASSASPPLGELIEQIQHVGGSPGAGASVQLCSGNDADLRECFERISC